METVVSLTNPAVSALRPYDPGHDLVALRRAATQPLIELGSNENAWGPSPQAVRAVRDCLDALQLYPDPLGGDLKQALAEHHGLVPAQIVLGNGSHELLMQIAQLFAGPQAGVVASQYGFAVYAIAAAAVGAPFTAAAALPATHAMPRGHDLDAIADAIAPDTRLVYLANPNNPTGTWHAADAFAAFMARVPAHVLVVVDEAYAEFADAPDYASAIGLLGRHPNLLVTRTFSKAHGLAGLRIGYAMGDAGVIGLLERLRESFNVNLPALAAAQAALADADHLGSVVQRTAQARTVLREALLQRGLAVGPAQTNFLLVDLGRDAASIEESLLARGIVLRPMRGYGLPHCLRITVGTDAQNAVLLAALDEVLR